MIAEQLMARAQQNQTNNNLIHVLQKQIEKDTFA
jgi:hypothetical protein